MAQVIDTRDLIEKRDELKDSIMDNFRSRINTLIDEENEKDEENREEDTIKYYNELLEYNYDDFKNKVDFDLQKEILEFWVNEINEIEEIDNIEEECSEFKYGETLINEDYWEEYCQELCIDCGYISKDFPNWIEIDWEATSRNMAYDYNTITYQNEEYYFRQ